MSYSACDFVDSVFSTLEDYGFKLTPDAAEGDDNLAERAQEAFAFINELVAERDRLKAAARSVLFVMNKDSDGDWFICSEAADDVKALEHAANGQS